RSYTDRDLAFAEDLAKRVGLALDNARLFEQERAARRVAESAVDRLSRLHAFTAALAAAVTPEDVTMALVNEGRAAIGADVGGAWLLDESGQMFVASAIAGAASGEQMLDRFPRDRHLPLADAVRTGRPVFIQSSEQARYP